jgi:hypothetical protein
MTGQIAAVGEHREASVPVDHVLAARVLRSLERHGLTDLVPVRAMLDRQILIAGQSLAARLASRGVAYRPGESEPLPLVDAYPTGTAAERRLGVAELDSPELVYPQAGPPSQSSADHRSNRGRAAGSDQSHRRPAAADAGGNSSRYPTATKPAQLTAPRDLPTPSQVTREKSPAGQAPDAAWAPQAPTGSPWTARVVQRAVTATTATTPRQDSAVMADNTARNGDDRSGGTVLLARSMLGTADPSPVASVGTPPVRRTPQVRAGTAHGRPRSSADIRTHHMTLPRRAASWSWPSPPGGGMSSTVSVGSTFSYGSGRQRVTEPEVTWPLLLSRPTADRAEPARMRPARHLTQRPVIASPLVFVDAVAPNPRPADRPRPPFPAAPPMSVAARAAGTAPFADLPPTGQSVLPRVQGDAVSSERHRGHDPSSVAAAIDVDRIATTVHRRFLRQLAVEAERRAVR